VPPVRARVLAVAAGAGLVIFYLLRTAGGSGPSDRPPEPPRAARRLAPAAAEVSAGPATPLRNVFEYSGGMPRPGGTAPGPDLDIPRAAPVEPPAEPSPIATPPAVRLVGLLRRGNTVKAALAISGETVVLGVGESALGYSVLSIDAEDGVQVRTPEGVTVVVGAEEER